MCCGCEASHPNRWMQGDERTGIPSSMPTVSVGLKGAMQRGEDGDQQQDGQHHHADAGRALVGQLAEGGGPQAAGLGQAGGLAALVGVAGLGLGRGLGVEGQSGTGPLGAAHETRTLGFR